MNLELNFYDDWVSILRAELAALGFPVPANEHGQEICFRYFNYRKRAIDVRQRAVVESTEFTVAPELQAGYHALKSKIENGDDLRPYLSRRLTDPDYDDPMLNDWGIHHFHLGTAVEGDGFVERTGPLLYGIVESDRILCLQILRHANWTNRDLIRIWHRSWPGMLDSCRLRGFTAAVPQATEAELATLRRGNVFTVMQMDDGTLYYPPGGGITTSGLSAQVVDDCNWYARQMHHLEEHVRTNIDSIRDAATSDGTALPQDPVFRLHIHDGSFVAIEESINWGLLLFTPPTN